MKVVIAGGTGSVGRRVAEDLAGRSHEVALLTRSPRPDVGHRQVRWDGRTIGAWATELEGAVLLNLAGELVDCRPTRRNIEVLRRSRVEPTKALVRAAASLETPPALWIQMSTLAIYGDGGPEVIDEGHPPADGPPQMSGVARPWEDAARGAPADRMVVLRTGIVLDPSAPAFERLRTLTRFGFGGRIGRGDQWVRWIHLDDFLGALRWVCDHDMIDGVVHVTAAEPDPEPGHDCRTPICAASSLVPADTETAGPHRGDADAHRPGPGADRPPVHPTAAARIGLRLRAPHVRRRRA